MILLRTLFVWFIISIGFITTSYAQNGKHGLISTHFNSWKQYYAGVSYLYTSKYFSSEVGIQNEWVLTDFKNSSWFPGLNFGGSYHVFQKRNHQLSFGLTILCNYRKQAIQTSQNTVRHNKYNFTLGAQYSFIKNQLYIRVGVGPTYQLDRITNQTLDIQSNEGYFIYQIHFALGGLFTRQLSEN